METVSILQGGHERGVATVAFSGDGEVSIADILVVKFLRTFYLI